MLQYTCADCGEGAGVAAALPVCGQDSQPALTPERTVPKLSRDHLPTRTSRCRAFPAHLNPERACRRKRYPQGLPSHALLGVLTQRREGPPGASLSFRWACAYQQGEHGDGKRKSWWVTKITAPLTSTFDPDPVTSPGGSPCAKCCQSAEAHSRGRSRPR